ncbi:MAG TPA: hypothetical protein VJO33_12040 [Gemmatimonadaceae bacterium]|nr:hypothetical protein [Gemmatimonadaceae bacterium]
MTRRLRLAQARLIAAELAYVEIEQTIGAPAEDSEVAQELRSARLGLWQLVHGARRPT